MLSSIPAEIAKGIRLTLVFGLITGIIYPLAITGISQVAFHDAANGSLISKNGQVVGSNLIGQQFASDKYFHGRVSSTSPAYAADNSGGSNLGPSNQALSDRVASSARTERSSNGAAADAQVPVDLVTTDFSGFDPDVTEAAALFQVHRIAQARGLNETKVHDLVEKYVQGRIFWIFGEPHVNVLQLNMALDAGEAG
jgi:potassium-transporting ATPase KdpC subunit